MNKLYWVLFALPAVLGLVTVAHADSFNDHSQSWHQDSIADQDQALYQRLDIPRAFGVSFNPHRRVCTDTAADAQCDARVITDSKGTVVTNTVPVGYGPAQLRGAYQLAGTASGHPIIAIVDAYDDPNIANDLAAYSAQHGLPNLPACSGAIAQSSVACFQKVNQQGRTSPLPQRNSGWALEISLDVETAHALCQNCSILLVEASSASYSNLGTAVNEAVTLGAKTVSNSYGGSESSLETSSYDSYYNHPGVAIVASAGDSGYGVEYPAASKYVTAVGGTSLFLNADNSYNHEIAWSGTGSGCSAYEQKPTWQKDTGCIRRTVTDVSADADPNTGAAVYDSYGYSGQKGWFQVGGTSLASPIIAATYAQGAVPAATSENSLPYNAVASLHDVTNGSNGSCSVPYLCTSGIGYDGPTGLGSPLGTTAF